MENLTLWHPAEPRSTVPSETMILVAASVVAWFAIVAVLGARDGFVTPLGVPPLPILLGVLTPLAVFFAAYLLSRTIREFVLAIDPRLMMAMQAWGLPDSDFSPFTRTVCCPAFSPGRPVWATSQLA